MCTGQLLVTAVFMVVWMAVVSSCVPSPTAPLHLTSIQGRPEHINTSPFRVAVPVVESVEKLPGDCGRAGVRGPGPGRKVKAHAKERAKLIPVPRRLETGLRK